MAIKTDKKFFGLNAVLAVFEKRKADITRIYVTQDQLKALGNVLKWCAQNKKAYHVVAEHDLEKITEAQHHEGVCFYAREKKELALHEIAKDIFDRSECIVFLDGVDNPHNVGAIVRTCVNFGVRYFILNKSSAIHFTGSTARVAEGACEWAQVIRLGSDTDLKLFARQFGFKVYGTSSHQGTDLFTGKIDNRSILILGNEHKGMRSALSRLCDGMLKIPGTGAVESLNVATAAALFAAEHWRTHRLKTVKPIKSVSRNKT